jgi:hypothetical protein
MRADWPALLLFMLLAAVLLWATFLPLTQRAVRLAEAPGWVPLAGFYGPERNEGFSYRWSRPEARLTLPVSRGERYAIALAAQDGPGGTGPRSLAVRVNGTPIGAVYPDSTLREYRFEYTRPGSGVSSAEPLIVDLIADPRSVPGDARELGFVVAAVRWGVERPSLPWLAGLVAVQLGLLGLGCGLFAALRRERGVTPLLIGYAGAATLSWLVASLHPAMILGLAALGLLIAVRRAPSPAIQPLGEPDGQRWLLALAVLGVWACAPAVFDPYNSADSLRGYVAVLLAGVATVRWLRARRPTIALGGYALATGLAAAWWHWLVAPPLAALPGLLPYDGTAVRLVPWVVATFGVAVAVLARLLPAATGRWLLVADLLTGLLALAFPAGLWLAWWGNYSEIELTLRVSWPGGLLVALLAAKAAVCGVALWHGAPGAATERRMALAVLALCAATAWSLAPWRMAAMGLSGDEPGYLAAALSLARDRDLELTNNGYAPWMLARVQYPLDAWGHEWPDLARDRLAGGAGQPAALRHELPVVAGPGLAVEIGVVNTAEVAAEIAVRTGGEAGEERFTLEPAASRLIAIPAAGDWRGATVEASAPVAVTVRLATAAGATDAYASAPPAADFCIPVPPLPPGSEATLLAHNGDGVPGDITVTAYDGEGRPIAGGDTERLDGDRFQLRLTEQAAPQTVCVAAERPLSAVLIARLGEAGLLVLPTIRPASGPLAVPAAPTTTQLTGAVFLIAHNPGDGPVSVRRAGDATPLLTLPPRATGQVRLAGALAVADGRFATLETDGPVVASFLLAFERHRAVIAPAGAREIAWFPAIVGEGRRFVATRVVVQNPGERALPVTVTLLGDDGEPRDERVVTICGGCASAVRLDFAAADGALIDANGAIVVRAAGPVRATVEQLTVQGRGFVHEWGLPVLLSPGAGAGGWFGALLIVAGCGALLVAQLYGLLRDAGITRRAALATVLALGLAAPLLPFSLLLYPEIPALLLLVTGLRLALGPGSLRGWRLAAALACALAIPLLHTRLLPLAAALAVCLGWRLTGLAALDRRAQRALLLAAIVPVGVIGLWWLARPLLPPPLALSSRLSAETLGRYFSAATLGHHLAGVAFDRATGLFPVAPLLLIAPAGLIALLRHAPRYAVWPGLMVGMQFAVVGLRAEGWEAWGPPGRYILPAVPLLALGVASAWEDWSPRWLRYAGGALAAWGLALALFLAWVPHAAYYLVAGRKWFGDQLLRDWGVPNPLRIFPEIKAGWPFEGWPVVLWALVVVAIVASGVRWRELRMKNEE